MRSRNTIQAGMEDGQGPACSWLGGGVKLSVESVWEMKSEKIPICLYLLHDYPQRGTW